MLGASRRAGRLVGVEGANVQNQSRGFSCAGHLSTEWKLEDEHQQPTRVLEIHNFHF